MTTQAASKPFMRTLQMTVAGSSDVRDVVVRIGLPEPDPIPGGDFRVLIEIDGFDQPYSHHIHGVDELHALLEGCRIMRQILPALAPADATLTWLGDDDLGFGASSATP